MAVTRNSAQHVLLLIDKGPSPELSSALKAATEIGANKVVDWAANYLARQIPPPRSSAAI